MLPIQCILYTIANIHVACILCLLMHTSASHGHVRWRADRLNRYGDISGKCLACKCWWQSHACLTNTDTISAEVEACLVKVSASLNKAFTMNSGNCNKWEHDCR